jgi:pyruvate formate lyase activating enzyme
VHLEATFVVLAGANDDPASLSDLAKLVRDRLDGAPLHVASPLALDTAAPVATMLRVADALRQELPHVYLSTVYAPTTADTHCRACRALLVDRTHPHAAVTGLRPDGRCAKCGADNHFRL